MNQREIKFRGISISTGKWLYGSLLNNAFIVARTKEPCLYIYDNKYHADSMEDVASILEDCKIENESVGQYTGLKDKNGKPIYEGDKLLDNSILNKEPERILTVEWRESECCFAFNEIPNSAFFPVYAPTLEVIGNIYENPELLTPPQP